MIRGAGLVLVAAAVTACVLALLRAALPASSSARAWVDERGWWLVWPVVAVELAVFGTWWLGVGALVAGALAYWLDTNGRLRPTPAEPGRSCGS